MNASRIVMRAASFMVAIVAFAADTVFAGTATSWRKWNEDWNGLFSDSNHWNAGVPVDGGSASIDANASYAVTVPAGGYTNQSAVAIWFYNNQAMTFDARETYFYLGRSEAGYQNDRPFYFGNGGSFFCVQARNADGVTYPTEAMSGPVLCISNALIRATSEGSVPVLHFDQGEFNTYDPLGIVRGYPLTVFTAGNNYASGSVFFHSGSSLRCGDVSFAGHPTGTCTIGFDGGEHEVHGKILFYKGNASTGTNVLAVTGGAHLTADAITESLSAGGKTHLVKVEGGRLDVGTLTAATSGTDFHIEASDGAELSFANEVSFGASGSKHSLSADGSEISFQNGLSLKYNRMRFVDSAVTLTGATVIGMGNPSEDDLATLEVIGGSMTGAGNFHLGDGYSAKALFDGGVHRFSGGNFRIGNRDDQRVKRCEMVVDGANTVVDIEPTAVMRLATAAKGVSILTVSNGVVKIAGTDVNSAAGSLVAMAWNAGSTGVVNVVGGSLLVTNEYGIAIRGGAGFINVESGRLAANVIVMGGTDSATTDESVLRQTGGEIEITHPVTYTTGYRQFGYDTAGLQVTAWSGSGTKPQTRRARAIFEGGVIKANRVAGGPSSRINGGTGSAVLEGDGGKLVVNATTGEAGRRFPLMEGFDEALVGDAGFEIESSYDVTIAQAFADKPAENGRLILSGSGTKSLTKSLEQSELVVDGGSVVFSGSDAAVTSAVTVKGGGSISFAGKATALAGLELGDGLSFGMVCLEKGEVVTVDGEIDFNKVRFALGDGFAIGDVGTVFRAKGKVNGIDNLVTALVAAGLPAGAMCEFVASAGEGGTTEIKMSIMPSVPLVIDVREGVSNATEDLVFNVQRELQVNVEDGAGLNFGTKLAGGSVVKTGAGAFHLTNSENIFFGDLACEGGLFSAKPLEAIGYTSDGFGRFALREGTLELGTTGDDEKRFGYALTLANSVVTNGLIVKTDSDIVMDSPEITGGVLLKRGSGRLTLESDKTVTIALNGGAGVRNFSPSYPDGTISFDDQGTVPAVPLAGLNIAEGELRLAGTGQGARFDIYSHGTVYVGLPVKGIAADPGLVVDNAYFNAHPSRSSDGMHFYLAPSCAKSGSDAASPYIALTNAATLETATLYVGCNAANTALNPRVVADSSTMIVAAYLWANRGCGNVDYLFSNGSLLQVDEVNNHALVLDGNVNYKSTFRFDASKLEGLNGVEGKVCVNDISSPGEFYFSNGAEFHVDRLVIAKQPSLKFSFDGGRWNPGEKDYEFVYPHTEYIDIETTGKGLELAPADGCTYRCSTPICGDGGFVKKGAGSVVFGHARTLTDVSYTNCNLTRATTNDYLISGKTVATAAYSGVTDIEEGTLRLEDGATTGDMVFTGAGTLSGVLGSRPTFKVEIEAEGTIDQVLTLADVSFDGTGRIDLSRTSEDPLEKIPATPVTVLRYTGSAPDVSRLKVVGAGRRIGGEFKAENGEVKVLLNEGNGLIMFVR